MAVPSVLLERGGVVAPWPGGSAQAPTATIGASSQRLSAVPAPPGHEPVILVLLRATGDCWYSVGEASGGSAVTAQAGYGTFLGSGQTQLVSLPRGQTIAVIQDGTATGTLQCMLPRAA